MMTALLLCLVGTVFAQNGRSKFGKVTLEELKLTACPFEADAPAFYLFDYGDSYTYYDEKTGHQLITQRHYRIKILNKNGLQEANREIQLFIGEQESEYVEGLKAVAYNLENGKIVETKLEKDNIFKVEEDDNHHLTKFAIPNVREGTVFEVQYQITSPFFTYIEPWVVQHYIPVAWSEYRLSHHQFLTYRPRFSGYIPIERDQRNGGTTELPTIDNVYIAAKVPSFRREPFLYTPYNYQAIIDFSLTALNSPYTYTKKFATTWADVLDEMKKSERFANLLKRKTPFRAEASKINELPTPKERMRAAFDFIKNYYQFDGRYRVITRTTPQKLADTKTGNSADINFALLNLLRECQVEAYPVVLSTRKNGRLSTYQPSRNRLNHLLACVKIDSTLHYLDASDRFSYVDLLPPTDYNGLMLLMMGEQSRMIELEQKKPDITNAHAELTLTAEGNLEGKVRFNFSNYGAYALRHAVTKAGGYKKYVEEWAKTVPGLTVLRYKERDDDALTGAIELEMDVTIQNRLEEAGNLLLLTPSIFNQHTENPFKTAQRVYPVEFEYPLVMSENIQLTLPKGYTVETLPKGVKLRLSDNTARYTYNVQPKEQVLSIASNLVRTQTLFLPERYDELRSFYQHMVDKEQEKIILKKL